MASPGDHELAHRLAEEAGERLLELRSRHDDDAVGPWQRRDEGDRLADDFLLTRLRDDRPADAILSEEGRGEEGPHGADRLGADRVWIIDPLDGTREFGDGQRPDWAVHVALAEDHQPTAAAIALPARGIVLSTHRPPAVPAPPPARPRIVVSRTRPPAIAHHIAAELGGDLVPLGSAGAKVAAVVLGEADLYVHAGGQYEWDSCAPVGVARAAGCFTSRIDLSPLRYNRPDPWLPDLLVANPALEDALRSAVRTWDGPGA